MDRGRIEVQMKRMTAVLALVACLGAAGCSGAPGEPDRPGLSASVPEESPSIIGDIKQVEQGSGGTRILVEQIPTRSAGEPIAWITLTGRTRVLARADGQTTTASAGELAVGTRVQVWFTGPVAESFPVQATAGTVLIER
jgi:ABC-type glycerol-3-phosphate transport system substrate-binding protein